MESKNIFKLQKHRMSNLSKNIGNVACFDIQIISNFAETLEQLHRPLQRIHSNLFIASIHSLENKHCNLKKIGQIFVATQKLLGFTCMAKTIRKDLGKDQLDEINVWEVLNVSVFEFVTFSSYKLSLRSIIAGKMFVNSNLMQSCNILSRAWKFGEVSI